MHSLQGVWYMYLHIYVHVHVAKEYGRTYSVVHFDHMLDVVGRG